VGAEPYWYFVSYRADVNAALQELREQEIRAGRYNPVMPFPQSPEMSEFVADFLRRLPDDPAYAYLPPGGSRPGVRHATIEEAREAAGADGTRPILDLDHMADRPEVCAAAPVGADVLQGLYGTAQPTRDMVEENMGFLAALERGHGVSVVLYRDGRPDEVLFAGYSFD